MTVKEQKYIDTVSKYANKNGIECFVEAATKYNAECKKSYEKLRSNVRSKEALIRKMGFSVWMQAQKNKSEEIISDIIR
jgi:hypothetical protein